MFCISSDDILKNKGGAKGMTKIHTSIQWDFVNFCVPAAVLIPSYISEGFDNAGDATLLLPSLVIDGQKRHLQFSNMQVQDFRFLGGGIGEHSIRKIFITTMRQHRLLIIDHYK